MREAAPYVIKNGLPSSFTYNNLPIFQGICGNPMLSFLLLLQKWMPSPSPGHITCQLPPWSTAYRLPHNIQWVSEVYSEPGRSIFIVNSCSFAVEKRGLRVRRDRTAQSLMFLQNYLVDKCSIINLNPLAKRIHKYLNNGLFRVLPVYQTCHMSTFYIFSYCWKEKGWTKSYGWFLDTGILSLLSKWKNALPSGSWFTKPHRCLVVVALPTTVCFLLPCSGVWPAGTPFPSPATGHGQKISSGQRNMSWYSTSHNQSTEEFYGARMSSHCLFLFLARKWGLWGHEW